MKESILYIDDEEINLDSFKQLYDSYFEIHLCKTPSEALTLIEEHNILVVVSDQKMPDYTGLEICHQIRTLHPHVCCIILSAYLEVSTIIDAINQGDIFHFAQKPFKKKELLMVLKNALTQSKLALAKSSLSNELNISNKELQYTHFKLEESTKKISAQEKELSIIFDKTPIIMIVFDELGNLLKINKTGLDYSELYWLSTTRKGPGHIVNCINAISTKEGCGNNSECNFCPIRQTINTTITTNEPISKKEICITTWISDTQFSTKTFIINCDILNTEASDTFLLTLDDITERKQLEEDLLKFRSDLERTNKQLGKQNEELNTAKQKAEESDKLKTSFLQNMSHEIRTPMNGIIGFTTLLKSAKSKEKQDQYLSIIEKSSKQLLQIVTDILDISKIETGQISINYKTISINGLLTECYCFFKHKAEEKGLKFEITLPQENYLIKTDDLKIKQIISNLIDNAIKYTTKGNILIGLKIDFPDLIEIWIEDTGIGISINDQHKIFERFNQVDINKQSNNLGGTGLGLSIAQGYTKLLNGDIQVESQLNKGSKFSITLPVKIKQHEKEQV